MSGWIYCITNSLYKLDDTYKLGYTSNKQTPELVKQHLIQRYGTYFPNVECLDLFEVKQPVQAEKQLFELLRDYKYSNELVKADYEMIIKPQLEHIKKIYFPNNERIITEQEKQKYKNKLAKKINNFHKHLYKVEQYFLSTHVFNIHNTLLIHNTKMCLARYKSMWFPFTIEKKQMNIYKKELTKGLSSCIEQYDYSDLEILKFVDFIVNLI
jgi:hypothetical protein